MVLSEVNNEEQRTNEFLAMLAHELRNPLAPLRSGLEVLKGGTAEPEFYKTLWVMERQLTNLVKLVDDLLDVSRIRVGKVALRLEELPLESVLKSALETSKPAMDAAHHHLSVSLPNQPIYVRGDATRLSQIFANLLDNAAKYTPERGRIRLHAERVDRNVVIRVEDNGVGIEPAFLPRVFDLFSQQAGTLHRTQGGLGLGLTLAQRLVEMHGGTIRAESKGPGAGSSFVVVFPLAMPAVSGIQQAVRVDGESATRARVLIVDDNEDAAEMLQLLLDRLGYDCQLAWSGDAALVLAETFKPQVVLLDIGLPGMSGYEVAGRLRSQLGSQVSLVAVTGWGSEDDRRRAFQAGFDDHMTKPVESSQLITTLTKLLAGDSGRSQRNPLPELKSGIILLHPKARAELSG
ncbi:MAG: ATP-binding protein [Myxococcales bacterium]